MGAEGRATHSVALTRSRVTSELVERLLGAYHLTFGVAGAAAVGELSSHFLTRTPVAERLRASMLLFSMGLVFVAVLLTGVGLIQSRSRAWIAALVLQLAQVPMWSVAGSEYTFVAGAYAGLTHSSARLTPFAGVMSTLQLGWDRQVEFPAIGVNLLPLVVAFIVWRVRAAHRKRDRPVE